MKWFENLEDLEKYKDLHEDGVAKRLFPDYHTNLIISFNCNNTNLNDILTKIGIVAYFKLLFLFLEKQFHDFIRIIVFMKQRSRDELLQLCAK